VGERGAQTSARQRDVLLEAGMALASELSLRAVLQRLVELAVDVTDATYGALGVLTPDGGFIEEFITTGISVDVREAIGHTPVGRGILGYLIENAEPLRLHDLTTHPRSVGFPANHPPMRTFLGAPVKARGRIFGNLYLTEKRGGEDFTEQDQSALQVLATQAGVAVENARLYEEARTTARRLEAVRDVTERLLEGAETDSVLQAVASWARELTGASLATIATPADNDTLVISAASGDRATSLLDMRFPVAESISGEVIRSRKTVIVDEAAGDARAWQPMFEAGGIGAAVFVPLGGESAVVGTLAVANEVGGSAFTREDIEAVEAFAGQAAVAIEYGRARRELQRLALLEDRERIAKELHDGVIQALFAVGMGLQGAAMMSRDADLRQRIDDAVNEIDRAIRDLRNYIFGLRPGILADRQLAEALQGLVEDFTEKTGIVGVADIDAEVAQAMTDRAADLVQLTREGLSNVGRHSHATTCRVSLRREDERAVLEIDDDGQGFDRAAVTGDGQGLRNLQERAAAAGGGVELRSLPGEGTTVRVSFAL
jgi:signal transduction histidine kinase